MLERRIFIGLVFAAVLALAKWYAHEREQLQQWASVQCAAAGVAYDQPKGKDGTACAGAIADLAAFRRDTDQATAKILADALQDGAARNTKAAEQARQAADAARAAAQHMEAVDAAVPEDDRVGGDWFDALNRTGGLRQPAD